MLAELKKKLLIKIIGALHFKFVLILPWNKVMLLFVFNSYPKKKETKKKKGGNGSRTVGCGIPVLTCYQ